MALSGEGSAQLERRGGRLAQACSRSLGAWLEGCVAFGPVAGDEPGDPGLGDWHWSGSTAGVTKSGVSNVIVEQFAPIQIRWS